MKKTILFFALTLVSMLNAQFRNGAEFVEFSKLSLEKQKFSLKANGWEAITLNKGTTKPNAAFKTTQVVNYKLKADVGTYTISIKDGTLGGTKMKETKLTLPDEQGLLLSDWISELSRKGFRFSQLNAYTMSAIGKTYTLIIKMIPSDLYSPPISEISYMSH